MVERKRLAQERNLAVLARIGARLRRAREQAGLSPRELAERVGTQAARVAGYERGTARLSARCLFQIARALEKPVAWFFEGLPEATVGASNAAALALAQPDRTTETRALLAAFEEIADAETRRDIIRLLRAIAAERRSRR
ncbi:MAG: helix-turn-helix domain-containing protein [Rhodospirillales bacterium]